MGVVGWLLIGSIPGVLIGSQLSVSVPDRPLRLVLASVLGLSGIKLLDLPGSTIVIVVLLGALMTGVLVWIGRQSWKSRQRGSERLATG